MGRQSQFLIGVALVLGPGLAFGGEFLVIGQVDQVTVLPKSHCEAPCSPDMICISNSCGCTEASIGIEKTLLGAAPNALIVPDTLDEWCRVRMPPDDDPILVHGSSDGTLEWSYLDSTGAGGSLRFEANQFQSIGGIVVNELPAVDGEVELGELERRLGL